MWYWLRLPPFLEPSGTPCLLKSPDALRRKFQNTLQMRQLRTSKVCYLLLGKGCEIEGSCRAVFAESRQRPEADPASRRQIWTALRSGRAGDECENRILLQRHSTRQRPKMDSGVHCSRAVPEVGRSRKISLALQLPNAPVLNRRLRADCVEKLRRSKIASKT